MFHSSVESPGATDYPASISPAEARFDRWRRSCGAVLTPVVFVVTWWQLTGSLTPQGRTLAAVLTAVATLWVTEALPLPVTSLLGVVLCIVLGVADAKTVLAPLADPIVFLFIGSFMLAHAMTLHRLDRRIALSFLSLRWIGGHPLRVLAGLGLVTAMMSMWVSNTATTAMMLPVALGVIRTLERMRGDQDLARGQPWPFASSVLLMIAYAASIGGVGTPVGSPPNLICIGLIGALAQVEISFFKWMALAVPMLVIMCPVLYLLLQVAQRQSTLQPGGHHDLQQYLRDERAALGSWSPGQINTLLAFLLAIALWLLPGVLSVALKPDHPWRALSDSRLPESVVALVAAILLFMLPVNWRERKFTLTWEEAVKIDWGTILLFGGGLSLGTLMFKTGVAEALGHAVADRLGAQSLWTITATSIALGIVISETTSNTAAANMIIPVAIALAQAAGVSPVPPALGACFGASFGFMLPVSTPPNAIVYSSRLVPITKMIKTGIAFDILGFFIVLGSLRVLCPLLGLSE